jgi:hypothetical protein
MPKTSAKTDKSQSQKFKEAARAIGCDEDEAAFQERLKQIAKAAPPDERGGKDTLRRKSKKSP